MSVVLASVKQHVNDQVEKKCRLGYHNLFWLLYPIWAIQKCNFRTCLCQPKIYTKSRMTINVFQYSISTYILRKMET